MQNINNYILEKLKINKNTGYESYDFKYLLILAEDEDSFGRLEEELGDDYLIDCNLTCDWTPNNDNENGFLVPINKAKKIKDKSSLRAYGVPPKYKKLEEFAYDWVRGNTNEDEIGQFYVNLKEL